jgi:hypothetical protein
VTDERITDRNREIAIFVRWRADYDIRRGAALERHFVGVGEPSDDKVDVGASLRAVESRRRMLADLADLDRERETFEHAEHHAMLGHAWDHYVRRALDRKGA